MLNIDRTGQIRFTTKSPTSAAVQVLTGAPPTITPGDTRWHSFTVHQELSSNSGQALNEVWIDGVKQAALTNQPNYPGQPQTFLDAGIIERLGDIQPQVHVDWTKLMRPGD